jgi:hypothetical protein
LSKGLFRDDVAVCESRLSALAAERVSRHPPRCTCGVRLRSRARRRRSGSRAARR